MYVQYLSYLLAYSETLVVIDLTIYTTYWLVIFWTTARGQRI